MGWIEALILGIVQGLTEYLPVSSSGHIEIVGALLGRSALPEENLLFTVLVHVATALSTIVVFRKRIAEIFKGLFSKDAKQWQFAWMVVISMIPAALVGVLLEDQIDQLFAGNLLLVGICLCVTAVLLFLADKFNGTLSQIKLPQALAMGIAQAIAILPGISRSGATIATGILVKTEKSKAAEFSFLMVIPLILGKMAKDILGGEFTQMDINYSPLLIGFLAAFVSGILACTFMLRLVKKSQLSYFAYYCFVVGLGCSIYYLS